MQCGVRFNDVLVVILKHLKTFQDDKGKIVITDSSNSEVQLSRKWRFKVAAEEYSQFDNYQYPYTSLYVYDKVHVSLSTRPKAVDINNKTLGSLYNGMIHPIRHFTFRGILSTRVRTTRLVNRGNRSRTLSPWSSDSGGKHSDHFPLGSSRLPAGATDEQ